MIQFRKSKKLGPFRFTLSQKGISSSVGGGPLRFSAGRSGIRRTVSIPGSGLSDTKKYGSGKRRSTKKVDAPDTDGAEAPRSGGGRPVLGLVCLIALAGIVWTACDDSKRSTSSGASGTSAAAPAPVSTAWADAPRDGRWATPPSPPVTSFRQTSEPGAVAAFREYTFSINGAPAMTTTDGGRTVTMRSQVTFNRIKDLGYGKTVAEDNVISFHPGGGSSGADEAYGTDPDVVCQKDRPAVGESTVCAVYFTASGLEIRDSYWEIDGQPVGTWPSQVVP